MDDIQREYRERLSNILHMKAQRRVKILLLESLINEMRELQELSRNNETKGTTYNYQVLSTSVSECQSITYQTEKDVQELQEKIIQKQMVRFEKNEQIQTLQQQLDEIEQRVRQQSDYNDRLKRRIVLKMQSIQNENRPQKQKQKSVLNKSFDAVAGILTFRWW